REKPHGRQTQRYFPQAACFAMTETIDEDAGAQPRQSSFQVRLLGVEMVEGEFLVSLQRRIEPLIVGGKIEVPPVHVGREAGRMLFQIGFVVGAAILRPLRMHEISNSAESR